MVCSKARKPPWPSESLLKPSEGTKHYFCLGRGGNRVVTVILESVLMGREAPAWAGTPFLRTPTRCTLSKAKDLQGTRTEVCHRLVWLLDEGFWDLCYRLLFFFFYVWKSFLSQYYLGIIPLNYRELISEQTCRIVLVATEITHAFSLLTALD